MIKSFDEIRNKWLFAKERRKPRTYEEWIFTIMLFIAVFEFFTRLPGIIYRFSFHSIYNLLVDEFDVNRSLASDYAIYAVHSIIIFILIFVHDREHTRFGRKRRHYPFLTKVHLIATKEHIKKFIPIFIASLIILLVFCSYVILFFPWFDRKYWICTDKFYFSSFYMMSFILLWFIGFLILEFLFNYTRKAFSYLVPEVGFLPESVCRNEDRDKKDYTGERGFYCV